MEKIKEDGFKPTLKKPVNKQSQGFEKTFKKTMIQYSPNTKLNEIDSTLSEAEQSLKKKIFSLSKMEALVFSDPKLSAVYDEMAVNGEEKYGYHYNETIMNMIFNDYVLNSPKYLQKYKMAIPKQKKRRDQSGINQLKKAGEEIMKKSQPKLAPSGLPKQEKKANVNEYDDGEIHVKVKFLVNEKDPENPDIFAYFPEENYDKEGKFKQSYSHIGQHSAVSPKYAEESREATPEEYYPLAAELQDIGYTLEVLNQRQNESSDAGSAGGDAGFVGYAAPMGYDKQVDETTSVGSAGGAAGYVGYAGPAAWGSGDLMKTKKKSKVMRKPIWKGGTIIGESNYIVNPIGFEKFIDELNENINDTIINGTNAFNSDTVKNWSNNDKKIQLNTMKTGVAEGYNPDMYSTKEDLKELLLSIKARGQKFDEWLKNGSAALAGEALYTVAIAMANKMLPITWNEMSDTNSMWDYIDENGNMGYERLKEAVKEAVDDRMSGEDMGFEGFPLDEVAKSKAQQRLFGMAHAVQKGDLNPNKVGGAVKKIAKTVSPKDVEDFASTKHEDLPEKVDEDTQTMIQNNGTSMSNKATPAGDQSSNMDMGARSGGGMSEALQVESANKLLEELNNELEAFSIHQSKLKKMSEDRKPSALVLRDRVGSENEKNFKSDLQKSGTKEIINVEKELQWKDQQTEVGKDPQKLGLDIEKKEIKVTDAEGEEHLKNVGDSANDKGDEIPKRNRTEEEQHEVDMHRLGQQDLVYDNEPGKRFEDRMKADMGDKLYKERQEKMEWRSKAPMYNKDPQPVIDPSAVDKVQFNKEKSTWNEREGLKECAITGSYVNALGKRRLFDFQLSETLQLKSEKDSENLFELNFAGIGNAYDNKVEINENVNRVLSKYRFYTDGNSVYRTPSVKRLTESKDGKKPVINEQFEKMKHLTGYKPNDFVNTKNVKKNRGF